MAPADCAYEQLRPTWGVATLTLVGRRPACRQRDSLVGRRLHRLRPRL